MNFEAAAWRMESVSQGAQPKRDLSRLEDYLEVIYNLNEEKGFVSAADISDRLGVKPPTVSAMVSRLAKDGYLEHEPYRGMRLTEKGENVALAVVDRHSTIFEFLSLLGVDKVTAYQDAEGIEHHIQPKTLKGIGLLVRHLRENPDLLKKIKGHARGTKAA